MNKRCCFIGHRRICDIENVKTILRLTIKTLIGKGYKSFKMGTHGEFDKLALCICRELKKTYLDLETEVVVTSFKEVQAIFNFDPVFGNQKYLPFQDVKTLMYDIEEEYYKRKIIKSNQRMIENSDCVICDVDPTETTGGAIIAYKYAKKKGIQIVNLFNS